jgi:UDP-N-acetylmuramate--alanine ligase
VLGKTRRVHFIGVGGIGMSGIAELLANLGYVVTGSDERTSPVTARLAGVGVQVHEGHAARHVVGADVVVVSSAVRATNPEVVEALRRHIPVIPRAEMLAELMRLKVAIAVAGAHGKTTTTSMIALVLERAGLDPTAVIGGRLSAFGSNARLGRGELMVAEADESDRSFLKLFPTIAVITNIDDEHLESYGSFGNLQQAFVDFANKVPFYGSVVCSVDDRHLAAVIPHMTRRVTTYGLDAEASERADLTASDVVLGPLSAKATVRRRQATGDEVLGSLELRVPGRHNLSNALAAVCVGLELGLTFAQVKAGLEEFHGVERRFDIRGEPAGVLVVDDYGHHPTEIEAVLAAARSLNRRLIVAFQPHRYTRTKALLEKFGPALAAADHIVLTDIYPAGEDAIPDVTLDRLAAEVRRAAHGAVDVVPRLADVPAFLARIAAPGDVVVTLGAGSIGSVADRLVQLLTDAAHRSQPRGAQA